MLGLARRLQEELVVLRGCSDRYVMRVVAPFFEAGWGLSDLVGAVDRRPDGSLWPHSGARGVREPARWLIYRLSAWIDGGVPVEAPSMSRRREHARVLAARAREEARRREREARTAAERESRPGGAGSAQARARSLAGDLSRQARRWRWSGRS